MSVLLWAKPKKTKTKTEWAEGYGFEDGPTGGYQPNMSPDDELAWKAKLTGTKLGFPQVEIRKKTTRGSLVLLIVNLGQGYNYKSYEAINSNPGFTREEYFDIFGPGGRCEKYLTEDVETAWERNAFPTKGINVHLSTNGPIQMTFDEMADMQQAVAEARVYLESLPA